MINCKRIDVRLALIWLVTYVRVMLIKFWQNVLSDRVCLKKIKGNGRDCRYIKEYGYGCGFGREQSKD